LIAICLLAQSALATPTEVTVRVLAKDAKFIGTSMGGVLITIKDADTGELLASGMTAGSTGDTRRIMVDDHKRFGDISNDGSAHFTTTLDLIEPRPVTITAFGPYGQRQGAGEASVTQWIVPGKHINQGDAVLLVMPGFAVDILGPPAHLKLSGLPQSIELKANVVMMCGCPIEPGGLWDANRYEVKALLKRNGKSAGELELKYAGSTSQFAATWQIEEGGVYEAIVYAYDPSNGNTGLDRVTFAVKGETAKK
jgi:hypothetical protein